MGKSAEKTKRKELSRSLKLFFGVGDFGFSMASNIESYYFTSFLTDLAQFSLPMVTMITTISSMVDALLSWMYGAVINSAKPMKWGRYRSWLIALPWMVPFLYAFQFIKIGNGMLSAVIIIAASIISHIAWNFPYIANVSMISVASSTPEDRSQLSATRGAWANLSKVVFSYAGPAMASLMAGIVGEVNKYGGAAFAFGCLFAVLYYVHFRMFDGYEDVENEIAADSRQEHRNAGNAGDAKTVDAKTVDAKTVDAKTEDVKTADAKAADTKTEDVKTADAKTADTKTEDVKTADAKAADTKTVDAKTGVARKNDTEKTGAMDLVRSLIENPPLIALLITDFAKNIFNIVLMGLAAYYFTYVIGKGSMLANYILVSNLFCVAGSYLSKKLCDRLSTRTTAIGIMFLMALMLIVSFLFYGNTVLVIVLISIAMFGYGIVYACMPALYGDTIVYSEWKTGKNAAGWISGLQAVPLKIAIMMRGIIITFCLAQGHFVTGMNASEATDLLKRWISIGFMIIPAAALFLSVFCLKFGFNLTREKVNAYSAEIEARRH